MQHPSRDVRTLLSDRAVRPATRPPAPSRGIPAQPAPSAPSAARRRVPDVTAGAANVAGDDRIAMYYGSNKPETEPTVNADIRPPWSTAGMVFENAGLVLDHSAKTVWDMGDELFPVAALEEAGRWILHYLPNGTPQAGTLGVAWHPEPGRLDRPAGIACFGRGRFVLFTHVLGRPDVMHAWWVSTREPQREGKPLVEYRFEDFAEGTVALGRECRTWFIHYRDTNLVRYGLMSGPRREPLRLGLSIAAGAGDRRGG